MTMYLRDLHPVHGPCDHEALDRMVGEVTAEVEAEVAYRLERLTASWETPRRKTLATAFATHPAYPPGLSIARVTAAIGRMFMAPRYCTLCHKEIRVYGDSWSEDGGRGMEEHDSSERHVLLSLAVLTDNLLGKLVKVDPSWCVLLFGKTDIPINRAIEELQEIVDEIDSVRRAWLDAISNHLRCKQLTFYWGEDHPDCGLSIVGTEGPPGFSLLWMPTTRDVRTTSRSISTDRAYVEVRPMVIEAAIARRWCLQFEDRQKFWDDEGDPPVTLTRFALESRVHEDEALRYLLPDGSIDVAKMLADSGEA